MTGQKDHAADDEKPDKPWTRYGRKRLEPQRLTLRDFLKHYGARARVPARGAR